MRFLWPLAFIVACTPAATGSAAARAMAAAVRLTSFDCGRIDIADMGEFSADNAKTGVPGALVVPCFLVEHPRGTLVWDTGLTDSLATSPAGADEIGDRESVKVPFRTQLERLGYPPERITFVAFSHFHDDHTGNANLFAASTWLLDKRELDWAVAGEPDPAKQPFSGYRNARLRYLGDGDVDLFGDGTVRLLTAPGHTPGHRVLAIALAHAGTVILSGDLAHSRANWENGVVPHFNVDRQASLRSMARIRALVPSARLVIEHDPGDFAKVPRAPAWLD